MSEFPFYSGDVSSTPSENGCRIYFVGAHSTGKTTLARYVSKTYRLPMITEVARTVLAESELGLDRLRTDINVINDYQREVFLRQMEMEKRTGSMFVSDRAFDNLAYAAEHGSITHELVEDPRFKSYVRDVSRGVVFFVRPHVSLLACDGIRTAVTMEDVTRIDGMIKLLLEIYAVPYTPISTPSFQERVRIISSVVDGRFNPSRDQND